MFFILIKYLKTFKKINKKEKCFKNAFKTCLKQGLFSSSKHCAPCVAEKTFQATTKLFVFLYMYKNKRTLIKRITFLALTIYFAVTTFYGYHLG